MKNQVSTSVLPIAPEDSQSTPESTAFQTTLANISALVKRPPVASLTPEERSEVDAAQIRYHDYDILLQKYSGKVRDNGRKQLLVDMRKSPADLERAAKELDQFDSITTRISKEACKAMASITGDILPILVAAFRREIEKLDVLIVQVDANEPELASHGLSVEPLLKKLRGQRGNLEHQRATAASYLTIPDRSRSGEPEAIMPLGRLTAVGSFGPPRLYAGALYLDA